MSTIKIENLSVSLGNRHIIKDLSCSIAPGRLIGLIGPNGAGKTTLLKALAGLVDYEGRIQLNGVGTKIMMAKDLAKQIAYMPQGHEVHWPLSVDRLVALGRLPHLSAFAKASAKDQSAIDKAIARADIGRFSHRSVLTLSAGEQARVMLARALAVEAPILLADEPVAALDPFHQLQIMELLRSLASEGATIIVVTHDLTLAARFCDDLILMHEGAILAQGSQEEVLNDERLRRAYHIEPWRTTHAGEPVVLPWTHF